MMKAKEVRKLNAAIQILWDDGQARQVDGAWLRQNCPCAVCREYKNPPNYSEPRYQRACQIQKLEPVGNYALGITFGDSHKGIFALDRLTPPSQVPSSL